MQGFAESRRDLAYREQLLKVLSWGAAALMFLFLVVLIPAVASSMRADKLQDLFVAAQGEVAQELQLREELTEVNALLEALNAELTSRPDYRRVLNLLASTTSDSTYLNLLALQGDSLSVTGFGDDASVFMQTLSGQPWLREVSAPSAFQRDPRSGKERFSIDAVITPAADQEGSADED
jgi:general secretion pathway protein L